MCGEDDRLPACQRAHVLAHLDAALRVQSGFGLVQHDDIGIVHQGHGQVEPALHPAGERAGQLVAFVGQPQVVEQLFAPPAGVAPAHAVHLAHELQLFDAGQPFPQHDILRAHADARTRRRSAVVNGQAAHHHAPRIRLQQATHHADGGRLAGPVRPEEAEHLTLVDVQRQVVHRDECAVAFGQALGLKDDVGFHVAPYSMNQKRRLRPHELCRG